MLETTGQRPANAKSRCVTALTYRNCVLYSLLTNVLSPLTYFLRTRREFYFALYVSRDSISEVTSAPAPAPCIIPSHHVCSTLSPLACIGDAPICKSYRSSSSGSDDLPPAVQLYHQARNQLQLNAPPKLASQCRKASTASSSNAYYSPCPRSYSNPGPGNNAQPHNNRKPLQKWALRPTPGARKCHRRQD